MLQFFESLFEDRQADRQIHTQMFNFQTITITWRLWPKIIAFLFLSKTINNTTTSSHRGNHDSFTIKRILRERN